MNAQTITASIVAATHRQSDAERIAELERQVNVLTQRLRALEEAEWGNKRMTVNDKILELLADGRDYPKRVICERVDRTSSYVELALTHLVRAGRIERVRFGVYRKAAP